MCALDCIAGSLQVQIWGRSMIGNGNVSCLFFRYREYSGQFNLVVLVISTSSWGCAFEFSWHVFSDSLPQDFTWDFAVESVRYDTLHIYFGSAIILWKTFFFFLFSFSLLYWEYLYIGGMKLKRHIIFGKGKDTGTSLQCTPYLRWNWIKFIIHVSFEKKRCWFWMSLVGPHWTCLIQKETAISNSWLTLLYLFLLVCAFCIRTMICIWICQWLLHHLNFLFYDLTLSNIPNTQTR